MYLGCWAESYDDSFWNANDSHLGSFHQVHAVARSPASPAPGIRRHPGVLAAYSAAIAQNGAIDCAVLVDDTAQSSSTGGPAAGAVSNLEETARLFFLLDKSYMTPIRLIQFLTNLPFFFGK